MSTILYNTDTSQVIGHYDPQYLVNGKPGRVDPPAIELTVILTEKPKVGAGYQAVSTFTVDLENKEYKQQWDIIPIPPPSPFFDLSTITKLLIRKVDGETLTQEEEELLISYKTQQENI